MDEEAEFEAWKAARAGTGDDAAFAAWKAKKKPLAPPPVAASDATAVTPNPKEEDDHTPVTQHIAETVVSGFPGAQRAVAGYRGLVSLLSGEGIDAAGNEVNNALDQQRRHVEQMPWMARLPLQMAGAAPAAALAAPLGVVKGGAAFGAAAGVDKPAKNVAERARNAAVGAGFGMFGAKAGEQAGELVGNLATRTGVTDRAAKAVEKIPSFKLDRQVPRATGADVAATMGTRGQVNRAFAERQDILDAIGARPGTGAEQQMNRIAATQQQAQHLYGVARQDKQPLNDPELIALLEDPQVKRAYEIAAKIREFAGNPLQQTEGKPIIAPLSERPVKMLPGPGAPQTSATPRAARRTATEGAVNPKYRLDSDEDLLDRAAELLKRQEEYSSGVHGAPMFVRGNPPAVGRSDLDPKGANTASDHLFHPISGETSVAHRMRQDHELYHEVVAELKGRGWPESDVSDEIWLRSTAEPKPEAAVEAQPTPSAPRPVVQHDATPAGPWTGPRERGTDIPDPQVLSSVKRYLTHAAEGDMKSRFPVRQEEALALLPKVQRIRDKLHEISPAWAKADAAYADAKGQEEAFINGYDAMRHSKSTVGKKLPQNSPEAMLQNISEPRYPGEPRGAMARRANAFREGIKAATSDQVRDASVDKNLTEVMNVPALGATENAAEVRNMMRAPGEPTTLEDILPAKRAELLKSGTSPVPVGRFGRMGRAVANVGRERDAFTTGKGQSLLARRLENRPLQTSEIAKFRVGDKATDYLRRLLSIDAGGQLAR